MTMKKIFASILSILFVGCLFAQTFKGRVISADDKSPVPFANVYYAGTSIGTSTDSEGYFELKCNYKGNLSLCASAVGYYTYTKEVSPSGLSATVVEIKLKPKTEKIDEVAIKISTGDRAYNLSTFKRLFLGGSQLAQQLKILNPRDLFLFYNASSNSLHAHASKPIKVKNKALGYEITFYLDRFEHNFNSKYTYWEAQTFFTESKISVKQRPEVEKNRARAYNGSSMHLMRALYGTDSLLFRLYTVRTDTAEVEIDGAWIISAEGLKIAAKKKEVSETFYPVPLDSLVQEGEGGKQLVRLGRLAAVYPYEPEESNYRQYGYGCDNKQTTYFTAQTPITIYPSGAYFPIDRIALEGYIPWEGVSVMLPLDYGLQE